eukprot:6983696-Pyramimonas_sp.AAC.1
MLFWAIVTGTCEPERRLGVNTDDHDHGWADPPTPPPKGCNILTTAQVRGNVRTRHPICTKRREGEMRVCVLPSQDPPRPAPRPPLQLS